ncbi:MAG: response regulator, partial [Microcoleus sp. SIO2G3]|nr:response regulator [Microcoleus sp. SIO2G3]
EHTRYEAYQAINAEVITSGEAKATLEEAIVNRAGEQRWYQTLITPFVDAAGQAQGIVGASIDITELRQAREAAEAANRAKSQFLANMSHELRTPLNAILGFAQLMSHDRNLTPTQQDYLHIINSSGEHLLQLINDVLSITKIEAGQSTLTETSFDLFALLDNLESLLRLRAETKGLKLRCDRALDLPQFITADEGKLRQVLINLIGNAIKFTDVGCITLRVRQLGSGEWGVGKREQPNPHSPLPHTLHFEIEDTGDGIPINELDRIFEPFVQGAGRQQQGTGLGLAISRRFVQQMGGEIVVSSQAGQGSLFMFDIACRLADPLAAHPKEQRVVELAPGQPAYRILVVDDTPANRQLMLHWLKSVGFEVQEAENGQQAIDRCATFAPDLIWMDMRMPGIDGYEATRQIRRRSMVQPKIIAVTAIVFEEERQRILATGCDDFVGKPCTESLFFEKIRQHLGVHYRYADDAPAAEPGDPADWLTSEAIAVMPSEWISQLDFAARSANDLQIARLLKEIPATHAPLQRAIAHLVHEFQLERLLNLTQPLCQIDR